MKGFIENHINVEERCSFVPGKSCIDNIVIHKQIMDIILRIEQDTYSLFVDLSKAYDNIPVPIKSLWKTFVLTVLNLTIINAVKAHYKESFTNTKFDKTICEYFILTKRL